MEQQEVSRAERFVAFVLERCGKNPGFAARLRRADNKATAAQSWEILLRFGVDLERDRERLPFALVGAALCRQKPDHDGAASLGAALRSCFGEDADPGAARLRRLLACESTEELCRMLRPVLALIAAKARQPLCFARLLTEALAFGGAAQERAKIRWARDFYAVGNPETGNEDDRRSWA